MNIVPSPPQARAQRGLGASQAAAALGVSPYARPIDVWLEATGRKRSFSGNEATRWGLTLEPVIRAHYVETNRVMVYVPPESLWHRELPWLRATPDGIVVEPFEEGYRWRWVGPQVKNVGYRQAPRWEDAPPIEYLAQAAIEMAVTDLDRLDFAVLIGGQEYRQLTVERDRTLEADILAELAGFWKHVESDTEPPLDGSDTYRDHLLSKIGRRDVTTKAPPELAELAIRWREIEIAEHQLAAERGQIKNQILAHLAEASADALETGVGIIHVAAGRPCPAWQAIARVLADRCNLSESELKALAAEHTTQGSAYLARPRNWIKEG